MSSSTDQMGFKNNPSFADYFELTKPKVVALLLLTAVVGMFMATNEDIGWIPPWQALVFGTIGIGFASGAAAVVNHVVDERIDIIMARTTSRPIPQKKVSPKKAITFATILAVVSMLMLGFLVNLPTAILTFLGLVGYAFVYTMYLKRATPQNIVIGGLSGAVPPLLGWTAVTGNYTDPNALLLVLIVYVWTPPHFWALAIHRCEDYAKAEIPMLPVTHGIEFTKSCIVYYTILLIITTVLPFLTGYSGIIYLLGALILGFIFLYYALKLKYRAEELTAIKTFGYSIVYLMVLFVLLLVDHYIIGFWGI
jgi:heme o synthase